MKFQSNELSFKNVLDCYSLGLYCIFYIHISLVIIQMIVFLINQIIVWSMNYQKTVNMSVIIAWSWKQFLVLSDFQIQNPKRLFICLRSRHCGVYFCLKKIDVWLIIKIVVFHQTINRVIISIPFHIVIIYYYYEYC